MTTQFNVTLAHPTSAERLNFNEKMFMQPKLDGIRCYITKDGAFSRNHKAFLNVGHILEDLQEYLMNIQILYSMENCIITIIEIILRE